MTSGKTAVSSALSELSNTPMFDLDAEIEKEVGGKVSTYLRNMGELAFRKSEYQVLKQQLDRDSFVLASGGGTPCYYDSMDLMLEKAFVVYLQWPISSLVQRLQTNGANRPLLDGVKAEDLPEFVAKHIFDRRPYYERAHYIVFGKSQTPLEIAQEILKAWKSHSRIL